MNENSAAMGEKVGDARSIKDSRSGLMAGMGLEGERAISKEWILEDEGYMVDEMEMRGSVGAEEGSWEESEAGAGEKVAGCECECEVDEDKSEGCLAWESQARGEGLEGATGLPLG